MRRKSTGQVALAFNLVLAIFVVGSLGLVSYEMSRILLAREQLKHCLELSALGGGAEMASTNLTGAAAQSAANSAAINILRMNSILGQPLTNSVSVATSVAAMQPAPGQVAAYCEYDDPITGQPAAVGQTNVLRVYGAYAYPLFSGGFGSIGVNVYTVMADATAGLPALDLMIVYNNDSSTDDQTPTTFVRRYWDPNLPAISYTTPTPGGGPESGPIFGITCAPPIGTPLNGLPPQNLDAATNPITSNCPKQFSEIGNTGNTVPLRGTINTGTGPGDAPPNIGSGGVGIGGLTRGPGNMPAPPSPTAFEFKHQDPGGLEDWLEIATAKINQCHIFEQPAFAWYTAGPDYGSTAYNPWNADPSMFTDVVVNLDGNNVFGGYTNPQFPNFPFPTLDFVVESSRGNMESNNMAPNVHEDNNIAAACQPGYLNAYQCSAYNQLQPKRTMEVALQGFMTKMLQTSDCHFGFVSFNDRAGLSPTDTATGWAVSYAYTKTPSLGKCTYALPQVPLSTTINNLGPINTWLTTPTSNAQPMFVPNGGSNLADGLTQAMANLTGPGSRSGAMKAILVVTDKVPTRDLAGNSYTNAGANGPALNDCMTVATQARNLGIPIFMVTVAQNATMANLLTQQFSDTQPGGLVNTAGSGGTLYVENWTNPQQTSTAVVGDFNNVIRQLMTLVKG